MRAFRLAVYGPLLSVMLVACVPIPIKTTYYLPSGGEKSVAVGGCGAKSRLALELPGKIELSISAYPADRYGILIPGKFSGANRSQAETTLIYVTFRVPANQRVQLTSDKVLLNGASAENKKELVLSGFKQLHTFEKIPARDYSATEELKGASREVSKPLGSYTEIPFYAGKYIVIDPPLAEFQLELPKLLVNGIETKISPISFQLRDEYVMTGLCP
jgi:hypothetical protein